MSEKLRIGSLFSGIGGLDLAVEAAFGATTAWHVEYEAAPSKVLAAHWPGVPNFGDVTKVDWSQVEPVDIIAGGSPCQDLSAAGRRAGMTDGTRSNLWVQMREAIAHVQPTFVVWENVRGAYSAAADSDLEICPGCVGDGGGQPHLRALGRVLGDLADLGFDAQWRGLRAADVGACHGRFRVFVLAWRRDAADTLGQYRGQRRDAAAGEAAGGWASAEHRGCDRAPVALLPTPTVGDKGGESARSGDGFGAPLGEVVRHLLPTPVAQPSGNTPEDHLRKKPGRKVVTDLAVLVENDLLASGGRLLPTPTARDYKDSEIRREPHRPDDVDTLARALTLLPTPSVADAMGGHERRGGARGGELLLKGIAKYELVDRWGQYAAAIARHEQALGRPAPDPTEIGPRGKPRLSPRFVEFMMMHPDGWATDPAIGLARNEQLKGFGNGVVPHQAYAALTDMLASLPWQAAA